MTVTKTIYPPAGATALLAAVDPQVEHLGWYMLPLILLSTTLTLITSLVINNIQRRYPTYWWTPVDVWEAPKEHDIEKASTKAVKDSDSSSSLAKTVTHVESTDGNAVRITFDDIIVPDGFHLAGEERDILEVLQDRLREGFTRPSRPSTQVQ